MTSKKGKIKQYKRWSTGGLDKIGKEGKDKMLVVYSEEMDRINKLEEQYTIDRVKKLYTIREQIVKGVDNKDIKDFFKGTETSKNLKKLGFLPDKHPTTDDGWIRLSRRLDSKITTKNPQKRGKK